MTRTRQIYEKAIEVLDDREAREMCTRFAEMETKLGEIDRARAIYSHCSQMCDPRMTDGFWGSWKESISSATFTIHLSILGSWFLTNIS